MRLGLDEIAKASGVSRSTVSRVINHDMRVSNETRLRVEEVIQRMHYQPNPAARSLAGGRSKIIGLVIPMGVGRAFTDPYIPQLIQGVTAACNAQNYLLMLWVAEPEYERQTMQQILNNQLLDGVIISSMLIDDPLLEALPASRIPFVAIGRNPNNAHIHYVDIDNVNSSQEMVVCLLNHGYRRVAAIAGAQNMVAGIDRLQGYLKAHQALQVTPDPTLVVDGDFTEQSGYTAMQKLLPQKPDAVFAASDAMAIGAIRAIHEAGLAIPADIAVAGFDDMPFAARSVPPLTTVRQPIARVGATAAETLIRVIEENRHGICQIILPTELIVRESCGTANHHSGK